MDEDETEKALVAAQMFFKELNCDLASSTAQQTDTSSSATRQSHTFSSGAPTTEKSNQFSPTAPSTLSSGECFVAESADKKNVSHHPSEIEKGECSGSNEGAQHVLKVSVTLGESRTVGNLTVQDIVKCESWTAGDEKGSGEEKVDKEIDQADGVSHAGQHVAAQAPESGETEGTGDGSGQSASSVHSKMHLCRLCGWVLDSTQDLMEHVQQHLSQGDSCTVNCHVCGRSFPSPGLLVQHLKAHSVLELVTSNAACSPEDGREVKCAECGEKFSTALLLYQHLLMLHTSSSKLLCPLCSATFSSNRQDKFLDHLMTHAAKPEVQCLVCQKCFVNQARLDRHMKIHGPREKKYLCDLCGKPFCQKFYYRKHMQKQHGVDNVLGGGRLQAASQCDAAPPDCSAAKELKFSCEICGKMFRSKGFMTRHMKAHAEQGPVLEHLRCWVCSAGFTSEQEKSQHVKQHSFKYDCGFCSEKFTLHELLLKHWRTDHPDYRPFKCGKCDKAYKYDYDRFRHELSHEGKRAFQCPHCPRQLFSRDSLKQHILNHHCNIERKKQFPCNVCGKLYYTKHAVYTHRRFAHSSRREYECLSCPMKFKTRQSLREHTIIHTGEKRYKCKHCDKRFKRQNQRKLHVIDEHQGGRRIWKCQDCESDFKVKSALVVHVRKVHFQCFHCMRRFPCREDAKKHKRCNQSGTDLYLKHHGIQVQMPSLLTVGGTDDEADQNRCSAKRDAASAEIIDAAESAERVSVKQNAQVPYTLTVAQDGKPTINMPRYCIRKRKVRRNFPKLVPEASAESAPGGTEGVGNPLTVVRERDIHTRLPPAAVCEALPQSVASEGLSEHATSSPSKLLGDKSADFSPSKFLNPISPRDPCSFSPRDPCGPRPTGFSGAERVNLCSTSSPSTPSSRGYNGAAGVNVTSSPSKTVSTTPLVVADSPIGLDHDHDYNSLVSVGVMGSLPEDVAQTILEQGISLTEDTTVIVFDQQESSEGGVAGTVYPPQHGNSETIPLDSFFTCLNESEGLAAQGSSDKHKERSDASDKRMGADTETVDKRKANTDADKVSTTRKRKRTPKHDAARTVSQRAKRAKTLAGDVGDAYSDHGGDWAREAESLFGAGSAEQGAQENSVDSMGKGVFIKVGDGDFFRVDSEDDGVSDSEGESKELWGKSDSQRGTDIHGSCDDNVSLKELSWSGSDDNFEAEDHSYDCDWEDSWNGISDDGDSLDGNSLPHAKNVSTDTWLDNKVRISVSHGSGAQVKSTREENNRDHTLREHAEHGDTDVNCHSPIAPSSRGHSGVGRVNSNRGHSWAKTVSSLGRQSGAKPVNSSGGHYGAKTVSSRGRNSGVKPVNSSAGHSGGKQVNSKPESTSQESQILRVVKQPLTLQLMKEGIVSGPLQPQLLAGEGQSTQPSVQIERRNFKCGVCDKVAASLKLLQDHLLEVHKYEEFYQCQHCFANVPSFLSLTAHFEQHARELGSALSRKSVVNGAVLNKPQEVGPLWEAQFVSKEKQFTVFVPV